jgi:hypothetical protein
MTHPDSAWEPTWPETERTLPEYPAWNAPPGFWTLRIPESDIRAAEEAAAAQRREAEERARLRQEREEARAQQAAEIREGLARLGRGELPTKEVVFTVNRRGVAPPKDKTVFAAAAAGVLVERVKEAEENQEPVDLKDAAATVLEDQGLVGKVAISTVLTHYRKLRHDPSYNPS